MVEPYWNDDKTKYAVLVSPGFGAGWSSWNGDKLAYDKRVVEFFLKHESDETYLDHINRTWPVEYEEHAEAKKYFEKIGYPDIYFGGFHSIKIYWVERGRPWRIEEYDGSETIIFQEDEDWTVIN